METKSEYALETINHRQQELTPATWGMINSIVTATATNKLEQAKIAQKMLFAFENGLPLNLAFNGGLYNVNNRVEVEGNVIRAQIRKHSSYDYQIIELNEKGCTLAITLNGNEIGRASFGEEDAKRAGLLKGKDNWEKYPADMYLNRATSRAYKRFCPDIFFTPVYVHGEIEGTDFEPESDAIIIEQPQTTLNDLVGRFSPDDILKANGGKMPSTQAEIEAVMDCLGGNSNG